MRKNARERYLPVAMFPAITPVIMLPGMKPDLSPYLYYGIWALSLGLAIMGVTWMANGAPPNREIRSVAELQSSPVVRSFARQSVRS